MKRKISVDVSIEKFQIPDAQLTHTLFAVFLYNLCNIYVYMTNAINMYIKVYIINPIKYY